MPSAYARAMSTDDEKNPPVPAGVDGKFPRKVHSDRAAEERAPDDHEALTDEATD